MKKGDLSDQGMSNPFDDVRLDFEKLIADLSSHFVNLPGAEVGSEIEKVLQQILEFFDVERCTIFQVSQIKKVVDILYLVDRPGQIPVPPDMDAVKLFPWCYEELVIKGNILPIKVVEVLPEEADADKASFESLGIRSILLIPLQAVSVVHYIISISSSAGNRQWPEEYTPRLRLLGEVLVGAMERRKLEDAQNNLLRFERLISDLSSKFAGLAGELIDSEIDHALEKVRLFFGADQCGIFDCNAETGVAFLIHRVAGEGIDPAPLSFDYGKLFPWSFNKIINGEVIQKVISSLDYPPEADIDRSSLPLFGVKSIIDVPISDGGVFHYDFSMAHHRAEYVYPSEYIPRLRLLGETLVSALVRKNYFEIQQRSEKELKKAYGDIEALNQRLTAENIYLRQEFSKQEAFNILIGQSDVIRYVKHRVQQVATTNATIMLYGETGTGKGLFAHMAHQLSGRRDKPFVTVGCAALPANLIESELFGREKGAFTGAQERQIGRFEFADGGTIFLDEIGELPLELQAKLLRVIEDCEFERLGSSQTRKVDVRIIAATNRNLEEEVSKGGFRQDLFFRLSVFPITIPALRQRRDDIPFLVEYYLEEFGRRHGRRSLTVPEDAMKWIREYSWPGNVRELMNVLERAVIISSGPLLQLYPDMADVTISRAVEAPAKTIEIPPATTELANVEREHIRMMLEAAAWRVEGTNGAAAKLGMNPSTLRARIRKLGIKRTGA